MQSFSQWRQSVRKPVISPHGFTLIEIIVSLFIIGLILGVTISRMDTMLEWDMKKASNKLAATIRYLYNRAASEGLYIRLTIDIDEHAYWVEATTDPYMLTTGEKERKSGTKGKGGEDKGDEGMAGEGDEAAGSEGEGEANVLKPHEPVFTQVDSYLLKPTKLPGSVFFKDLFVEHRKLPVGGGKESIYFFPNGAVEYAVINLRNEDDDVHYSLETNPISGQVTIENRYRSAEEEK